MIKSCLIQIKGYSFYMEDVILVTDMEEDCQGKYHYFLVYLKGNIGLEIRHTNKDKLDTLHTFLYNRRIRETIQNKTMNISDIDMSRFYLSIRK